MATMKTQKHSVETVHVQVRKDQMARLKKAADQVGLPVSTYMRTRALEAANRELMVSPEGGL